MLEVKTKKLNANMFGMPDQEMELFLGSAPTVEKGTLGMVPTTLLGASFTGEMGATVDSERSCIGIIIEDPRLKVDEDNVKMLAGSGIALTGAYNACSFSAYADLADKVAKALFIKGEVEPTLKLHFGNCGDNGSAPEQRPVKKVEIIMQGKPTGHPIWTLDAI